VGPYKLVGPDTLTGPRACVQVLPLFLLEMMGVLGRRCRRGRSGDSDPQQYTIATRPVRARSAPAVPCFAVRLSVAQAGPRSLLAEAHSQLSRTEPHGASAARLTRYDAQLACLEPRVTTVWRRVRDCLCQVLSEELPGLCHGVRSAEPRHLIGAGGWPLTVRSAYAVAFYYVLVSRFQHHPLRHHPLY
jgi:hypothetical protein